MKRAKGAEAFDSTARSCRSYARMPVRALLCLFVVLSIALPTSVQAAPEKRQEQDYRGEKHGTTPGEALLWVPRVGLFPLYLVSEYLVRQPVGALVRVAERENWPTELIDFFTFGDRRQVTIYPSALFDFGLKPSVGFNATWKYFLADPNTLTLHFGTWGPDWIAIRGASRYQFDKRQALSFEGSFWRRKDTPFYGMGPRSPSDPRYRYQTQTSEAALAYEFRFWRSSSLIARAGFRSLAFGDGSCCGEESVQHAVAAGKIPAPPGLNQGYDAEFQSLTVALDSRKPKPASGSGVRVEAFGEGVFAPSDVAARRRAWISYGGAIGAAADLWKSRIVSLNVRADMADPLLGTIPFTDQVSLGGERPMRGYLRNRLIDRSALVATLQYTWPVWVFLDGVFQTDVGNVFGEHFDGFSWDLLRLSSGIGVRSNGNRDSGFEILVAAATDPFESGFHVSSFRFVVGSHHGF